MLMDKLINTIVQLVSGGAADAKGGTTVNPNVAPTTPAPVVTPRVVTPQLDPNAMQAPPQQLSPAEREAPVVQPAPAPRPATPQADPVAAQAVAAGPLGKLFAGKDISSILRGVGAGMANLGNTGGDPYVAFAHGFGGASASYDQKDKEAAAAEAASAERQYQHGRDARGDNRQDDMDKYNREKDAADLAIRQASEDRQGKTSALSDQKTALEIKKLAAKTGLPWQTINEIEDNVQNFRKGDGLGRTPKEEEVQAYRQKLTDQARQAEGISGGGLDAAGGITKPAGGAGQTAVDEAGNTVIWNGSEWVPQ